MSGYERENKNVLRRCLKTASDGAAVTWAFAVNKLTLIGRCLLGDCVYGDYRGPYSNGLSCSSIGSREVWNCYNQYYYDDCCVTCLRVRNTSAPGKLPRLWCVLLGSWTRIYRKYKLIVFTSSRELSRYVVFSWIMADRKVGVVLKSTVFFFLWPPYVIGGHYIFALWFLSIYLLSFFPRLISAATDWMSTILLHMAWP